MFSYLKFEILQENCDVYWIKLLKNITNKLQCDLVGSLKLA